MSGVSSGGDFASDAERGDGDFGRGRVAASHDRRGSLGSLGSGRLLNDAHLTIAGSAHVSPSLPGVGGSMTLSQGSISQSDVVLRRVDSKTHVVEALASVPGLHKRGIDLPMTKRLAFRKCRGVARNRGLLALALMLFVVATRLGARRVSPATTFAFCARRPARRLGRHGALGTYAAETACRGMALHEEGTRFGTGGRKDSTAQSNITKVNKHLEYSSTAVIFGRPIVQVHRKNMLHSNCSLQANSLTIILSCLCRRIFFRRHPRIWSAQRAV